jgi:alpha-aminoadipate carrier protein LysW
LDDVRLFAAQGAFLMSAICPECDSPIDVDEYDVDIGDELTCSECGSLLRVSSDSPLEFELADEDDDLDEDDDDDREDEDEDEDADLDEDADDDEDDERIDDDE